jgi:hypothetical protein
VNDEDRPLPPHRLRDRLLQHGRDDEIGLKQLGGAEHRLVAQRELDGDVMVAFHQLDVGALAHAVVGGREEQNLHASFISQGGVRAVLSGLMVFFAMSRTIEVIELRRPAPQFSAARMQN